MTDTSITSDVKSAATAIGDIMGEDRKKAFDDLLNHRPDAGMFATAQWLEAIVDDRRNAVVEQYQRLSRIFTAMSDHLDSVAEDLYGTDADNAKALDDFDDMKSDIDSSVGLYDTETEEEQHNFDPAPGKKDDVNNEDGNGWNDNLSA